jgi:hypothetical protein
MLKRADIVDIKKAGACAGFLYNNFHRRYKKWHSHPKISLSIYQ